MKKHTLLPLLLVAALLISGCGNQESVTDQTSDVSTQVANSDMFSDRDYEVGYDESDSAIITLNGDSAECSSNAVQISGTTVTIIDEGTYILSGTLNDGMIIVNSEKTDKTQLVLDGVTIINHETGRYFLLVSGNDASRGWGKAGANGGQVEFTADGQTIEGDIAVDTVSALTMVLTNGSAFTGTINIIENGQNGTAVENNAVITIDSGCTWDLTGDCTITSLTNNGTIDFNGYTITLADGTVLGE